MLRIVLLLAFFTGFTASAQNLTGIWRGHFNSGTHSRLLDSLGIDNRYKFETQISQNSKGFEGVTYSYRTTVFYGKAACVGTISQKTKKVLLGETRLLEVKSADGGACLMTCFLQYSKVGDEEFLEGTFTSISVRDSTQCGGGTVFLRKVTTSDFYKEPFLVEAEKARPQPPVAKQQPPPPAKKITPPAGDKKTTPPAVAKKTAPAKKTQPANKPVLTPEKKNQLTTSRPQQKTQRPLSPDTIRREIPKPSAPVAVPRVLVTRKNELVQTILSAASEVYINIYDNGTIDNDTVSVYVDNQLVISKQRLTDKAITIKIGLDDNVEYHELIMVAENLGEIPPNTSLMVVKAGDERYEVRITSNEQKNAVVRFKRK